MVLKICGIRRMEDVTILNEFPPDYAGFVFADSRRQVGADEARRLIEELSPQIIPVGVFVNEDFESLIHAATTSQLKAIQLHGDEDEEYIIKLKEQLPDIEIWKAIRVKNEESLVKANSFTVDKLLCDAFCRESYGGTGTKADWDLIRKHSPQKAFFLAGGLTLEDLITAVQTVRPWGIDLSSGVETDGVKDRGKIAKLTAIVKGMDNHE